MAAVAPNDTSQQQPSTGGGGGGDKDSNSNSKSIVFFHPDLGIGGAERLVVDAAVGLQERGHRVVIFTNHCDPNHCFEECKELLDVRVRGSWLFPPSFFSRFTILCAILRHVHLLLTISLTGELAKLRPTAFVVDQLSACLPVLRYISPAQPILFYCHYPDLLLVKGRSSSLLKRLYRLPFDQLEEMSMDSATAIAVNSKFTKAVVATTWPALKDQANIKVIYPCVDTDLDDAGAASESSGDIFSGEKVLLSINRFDTKKDIELAIMAFVKIYRAEPKGAVRLVIAGGYDARLTENVEYLDELRSLADSLSIPHHTIFNATVSSLSGAKASDDASSSSSSSLPAASVAPLLFLPSIPSQPKSALLRTASLLIYTPSNEHFGIVPLEAMLAGTPVVAADNGGPVETILDGETGWLRDPEDIDAWTSLARAAVQDKSQDKLRQMGEKGRARVMEEFGRAKMAERFDQALDEILKIPITPSVLGMLVNALMLGGLFFLGLRGAEWLPKKQAKA